MIGSKNENCKEKWLRKSNSAAFSNPLKKALKMDHSEQLAVLLERLARLNNWSTSTTQEIAEIYAKVRYKYRRSLRKKLQRLEHTKRPATISDIKFLIDLLREASAFQAEALAFKGRSGAYRTRHEGKKIYYTSNLEELAHRLDLAEKLIDILENPRKRLALIEQDAVTDWTSHISDPHQMPKLPPALMKIADLFEEYVEHQADVG